MGRACNTHGKEDESVQGFGGKIQKKSPLVRPRRRREDGIRMDLREIGLGLEWIQLAQVRCRKRALVNTAMNIRVQVPRIYIYIYILGLYITGYMRINRKLYRITGKCKKCGGR
jgi:hypothetical protein